MIKRSTIIKYILLLALCLFLTACANETESKADTSDNAESVAQEAESEETEIEETEIEETEAVEQEESVEEPKVVEKDFTYEVVREDASYTTEDGKTITDVHFEKLVFSNPDDALTKINNTLDAHCQEVLKADGDDVKRTAIEDYQYWGDVMVESPYMSTNDIVDVYMNEQYLSITMERQWFAGGVMNIDKKGYNFDLNTGEEITVATLFNSEEEAKKAIVDASLDFVRSPEGSNYMFMDAENVINQYDIQKYNFSFDENTIYILYQTYELAAGADGNIVVEVERP
ncbi:MAG: DUF3298 domain-containing protein [Lachnospiraceae bacterium]|nr:DUF3298 domain-containing protein [Lachnospiraceae bacterium]